MGSRWKPPKFPRSPLPPPPLQTKGAIRRNPASQPLPTPHGPDPEDPTLSRSPGALSGKLLGSKGHIPLPRAGKNIVLDDSLSPGPKKGGRRLSNQTGPTASAVPVYMNGANFDSFLKLIPPISRVPSARPPFTNQRRIRFPQLELFLHQQPFETQPGVLVALFKMTEP